MSGLQIRFLGTLEIRHADRLLPKPATLKSQSLLTYLIFHRNAPQRREHLSGLFWGEWPEEKARRSLSTALWHIRRCLPDEGVILSNSETVQIVPTSNIRLDVDDFLSLAAQDDIANLQSAIDLYRGEFLSGFYDDWVVDERYRLETIYCDTLARLMVAYEARNDPQSALNTASKLLAQDPFREDGHRLVMRAYCKLGQRNAALIQYRRCQEEIKRGLGIEPMPETRDLYNALLTGHFEATSVKTTSIPPSVELLASPGQNPLDPVYLGRMVGREKELVFLESCWTHQTEKKLVLLSGEAGTGKTRLITEFANRLRWAGFRVLWGRCYEFERLLPYQPFGDALRTVLPTLSSVERAHFPAWVLKAVCQLTPECFTEETGNDAPYDVSYDQARLFSGVTQFLSGLSKNGALLVVLEDLHWGSESTLQLLHYLTSHLVNAPVLVIGTYRSEAIDQQAPLSKLREQLHQDGSAYTINLQDLQCEDVETMLGEMSGIGDAAVPLARRLYQETEGNPFFLSEMIKGLFEKKIIQLEQGKWKADFMEISRKDLPLPDSVGTAIQERVRGLNKNDQKVLQLAAVLGREFDFDVLEAVWGRGDDATLRALDHLLRRRLIEEGIGPTNRDYVFTHHKIQEVVYSTIPRHRRQHLHAQVATAMEKLYTAQVDLFASEIAHHFEHSQGLGQYYTRKTIAYLLQAGDRARFLYAFQDALDYYQRALVILKKAELHEQAAQTLMKIGLTYHTALDFERSRGAYDEGLALWQWTTKMRAAELSPAPHALRMSWREPETLDPVMAEFEWSTRVIDQLFCGLVDLTPELDVVPNVAYSWDVLEAGHKYVFHLRDDVKWSDGTPVTADDFEYAWKRALQPAYNLSLTDLLEDIKGAKAFHRGETSNPDDVAIWAVDEFTLVVELEEPNGYFLYLIPQFFPMPRHVIDVHGEAWAEPGNIVTNGPFILDAWQSGQSMILSRNPRYHDSFTGNIHRVELCLIPSMLAQLSLYDADSLDLFDIWTLPLQERDRARQQYAAEYISLPELSTFFLVFDVSQPPFNDVRVRRAIALATDKEKLANVIMRGCVAPATGGLIPPGMSAHSSGIGLLYDPDRAKQLLVEAGYFNGNVQEYSSVDAILPRGALIPYSDSLRKQWMETLGVDIRWQAVELASFSNRVKGQLPGMFLMGWMPDCPDPGSLLRANRIQQYTHWRSERFANLVEKAGQTTNQADRMNLYREADRLLIEEASMVPLTYGRSLQLVKPWVKNYSTSPITRWLWKDFIIEPH